MVCLSDASSSTNLIRVISSTATWDVDVTQVPYHQAQSIYGLTDNARNTAIQYRFQRFRFPFVHFEWHVETPYHTVSQLIYNHRLDQSITVKFIWKAWTKNYAASGKQQITHCFYFFQSSRSAITAFGSCTDTLVLQRVNGLGMAPPTDLVLINSRQFVVTKVIQPELMKPVPYPRGIPEYRQQWVFVTVFE